MKILRFKGEVYEAEKIVRKTDAIIGYTGQSEVFSFRGINDWTQFQLEGEWDIDEQDALLAYLLDMDFRISLLELGVL